MIEITHRYTKAVLYRAESATSLREAVEAGVAAGADLRSADLGGANLGGADLAGADLGGANLGSADLAGANLRSADLRGANLGSADLGSADLRGADLGSADLWGATGVNRYRTSPLYLLLDQPGPIRLYKLVTAEGIGPFNGGITYAVGETYYEAPDADTDEAIACGAGINLATLDWCLREWREGFRILVAEFTAADIAAIPLATDGKIRVRRCAIVAEKSLDEVGITAERAARGGS